MENFLRDFKLSVVLTFSLNYAHVADSNANFAAVPVSPQEWVNLVRNDNLKDNLKDTFSETGGKYNYSNFGYVLLGKIIEDVSGDNYASFMNRFLKDELGLKETGYVETDLSDAIYGEPLVWSQKEQSSF
jgi:CubicO group peptidase (beta-lactamase class C family)